MLRGLAPTVLAFAILAGCAAPATERTNATGDLPEDGLVATSTTGLMRGLVVDPAIRALADVAVTIQRPGADPLQTTSGGDGRWGFDGLEPGTYSVAAQLGRYVPSLVVASVRAGEDDPELVRILLEPDVAAQPYVVTFDFNGFLQCAVRGGTGGANACGLAQGRTGAFADRSLFEAVLDPGPAWMQGEMVWKASQPLSDALGFYFTGLDADGNGQYMGIYPLNMGTSPLLLSIDTDGVGRCATCVEDPWSIPDVVTLQATAMAGELDATTPPPTCSPTGSPCLTGLGVVLNQSFDLFLHVFYRTTPPDGWRFSSDGAPPAG